MKELILTLMILTIFSGISFGQKVEKIDAEKIAKEVYKRNNNGLSTELKKIIPLGDKNDDDTLLYIVPFEESGYVIVSGQFAAPPVLGFCMKGDYSSDSLPPGLIHLIEKYKIELRKVKKERLKPKIEVEKQWNEMLSGISTKSYTIGTRLLTTTWGQQSGYNYFCPNTYPAGCTAVAMAQILNRWKCQISALGYVCYSGINWTGACEDIGAQYYNWNSMGNNVAESDNQLLIYMAGVSCQTHYTNHGSSSTPDRARDGFVNNWGISPNANVKWRIWHLSTWKNDLINELNLERPILYSAGGAEIGDDWVYGHSWVIEGYDSQERFYCNWGWLGQHDGYFSLGTFDDLEGDGLNQLESAIFSVYPVQTNGVATPSLANQSFTYSPTGYTLTIPPAFGATDYQWTTNIGTITGSGTSVTLNANSTATVQVRAKNSRCNIYSPFKSATITINYGPISAPNIICYSGATASIQNVPNTTITWGGTNVSYPYGNTGTSVTVRATSTSTAAPGTITATFTVDGAQRTVSKTIWAGKPVISTISGPQYLPYGGNQIYTASVNGAEGATYQWSVYPSLPLTSYGDNVQITFPSTNGDYTITLVVTGCGQSAPYYYYVSTGEYEPNIIFPNPASDETTLSMASVSEAKDIDEIQEWEYEVYTQNQLLKDKKTKLTGRSTTINTHGWQEGVYIVRVKYGKEIMLSKLVIKR